MNIQIGRLKSSLALRPRPEGNVSSEASLAVQETFIEGIHNAWVSCRNAVDSGDKNAIREFHLHAKHSDSSVNYGNLIAKFNKNKSYFPDASKVDPTRISPVLVPVTPRSLEEQLFKITRGYWSMPYSKGYGRRLRFLLMDSFHEAVIGIIGLQSPSADLACRDNYLGASKEKKLVVVNNTLEAYTIGASPTYAPLLGGKLVAGFLHSTSIRQLYWKLYGRKRTTQLRQKIAQPLLAITTSSAYGKSSIYNRLAFNGKLLAKSLGYTKGFGTIHLEQIYPKLLNWLESNERSVPAGFGNGPKVRWQNIMRALRDLGISREYLEHGLRREVYIFELVDNLLDVCQNGALPAVQTFDDDAWSDYWKERWCIPRTVRNPDWQKFDPQALLLNALEVADARLQLLSDLG